MIAPMIPWLSPAATLAATVAQAPAISRAQACQGASRSMAGAVDQDERAGGDQAVYGQRQEVGGQPGDAVAQDKVAGVAIADHCGDDRDDNHRARRSPADEGVADAVAALARRRTMSLLHPLVSILSIPYSSEYIS